MAIKGDAVGLYLVSKDIIVPECNIVLTQPTVKEVLQFGETNFLQIIQYLSYTERSFQILKQENTELQLLDEFQLFLLIYHNEPILRSQIERFFELIFPKYTVIFTDNSIDFKDIEDNGVKGRINPFNFESLQKLCLDLFLPIGQKEPEYNPVSSKAQEIAEKLKKGREEKARREGKQEDSSSLYGTAMSIIAIGCGIPFQVLYECTIFQLNDLFMRYTAKMAWDQYIKMATIPFSDSSKLEAPNMWTSNIYG